MSNSFVKLAAVWVLAGFLGACGESGGGGVTPVPEGDASVIIGKSVLITPSSGDLTFNSVFVDADTVAVSQSTASAALTVAAVKDSTIETQLVTYSVSGTTISYSSEFSDSTDIVVTLTVDASGNVTSGTIKVNGVTVTASFVVSSPTNPGTAADAIAAGFTALQSRNLTSASATYCNELLDSPANSQLAFGCFWAKLMLLPTTSQAGALLNTFGEPLFDPAVNYYGVDGVFTNVALVNGSLPFVFNYPDFNLPFVDFLNTTGLLGARGRMAELVELAVSHGVTTEELQDMLQGLVPHLAELEALLSIVLADTSFTFVLPKELFNLTNNVDVTYTDAELFMAGTAGSIFGLEVIDSYDLGVDANKVVQAGVFNNDIMLEDLNGTGATVGSVTVDTIAFATLANPAKIASAKPRFLVATSLTRGALTKLKAGETSDFFTRPFDSDGYVEAIATATELNASATAGGLTTLSAFSPAHTIKVNMKTFFTNPPNAATVPVLSGDPFIMDFGQIQFVESYFRDFVSGIATF